MVLTGVPPSLLLFGMSTEAQVAAAGIGGAKEVCECVWGERHELLGHCESFVAAGTQQQKRRSPTHHCSQRRPTLTLRRRYRLQGKPNARNHAMSSADDQYEMLTPCAYVADVSSYVTGTAFAGARLAVRLPHVIRIAYVAIRISYVPVTPVLARISRTSRTSRTPSARRPQLQRCTCCSRSRGPRPRA